MRLRTSSALALLLAAGSTQAQCPFASMAQRLRSAPARPQAVSPQVFVSATDYRKAADALDWAAVKEDIKTTLTTSQDFWPADFDNYAPFMIRLAWHCAGSYRTYDGLGGCDGARQRFDPERSWDDNTNLDKARKLLAPIKDKYGLGLSWGDLIIMAGTVAIESMGGPTLGFCAGRVDDVDGTDSLLLGPTPEQEAQYPCPVNGQCQVPLGANTLGLIYVNPEGPMGQPLPDQAAPGIREVFGRMSMNDSETVALIGGGHAFGKAHGACPAGPGPSPKEDPDNPWPGECGTGKGADAYTSGFEGMWTLTPTKWGNSYFQELLNNEWEVTVGPGGRHQWQTVNGTQGIMMLTTDVALLKDPEYMKLVQLFSSDQAALDEAFKHAFYKLVTRDMGPRERCIGPYVPPAQPFQNPLPAPPTHFADFNAVKAALRTVLTSDHSDVLAADTKDGKPDYSAVYAFLAWQAASTYRRSDYVGGANGARIRFAPEKDWPMNAGLSSALQLLAPLKEQFGEGLSWADLIVLAGNVALEEATGGKALSFCPGRTDASDGSGSMLLQPNGNFSATAWDWRWKANMLSLSTREYVALSGMPRSNQQMQRLGYSGSWGEASNVLSNAYFTTLLTETWEESPSASGKPQYKAVGKDGVFMVPTDLLLKTESDLLSVAQEYAADNTAFVNDFLSAWNKIMINDRYDGPTGNLCAETSVEVQA